GVALLRGSRQVCQGLPVELDLLTLSQLPRKDQMQYVGHGFLWNSERANQVLAVERASATISRTRGPGDLGGVTVLHAVGRKREQPTFLPLSDLEGHMLVAGATRTGKTHYLQLDVVQAIERGDEAVIFIDPKGDLKVLHRAYDAAVRSEEHTSELQSRGHLVCRLLLEKKKSSNRVAALVKLSIRDT